MRRVFVRADFRYSHAPLLLDRYGRIAANGAALFPNWAVSPDNITLKADQREARIALADSGVIAREGEDLSRLLRFLGDELAAVNVGIIETVNLAARFIETEGADNLESMARGMASAWNWGHFSAAQLGNVVDFETTHTVRINAQDVNVQVGPVKREQLAGLVYPAGTGPHADALPELAWFIGMAQVAPRTIRREWRHARDEVLHMLRDWEALLQLAWRNTGR
jgi:hypothetical protein